MIGPTERNEAQGMTDCTERRPPAADDGRDREGHEGMPKEAQS